MQDLSKKILKDYQTRQRKHQKTAFIELLKSELKECDVVVEESGFFKSRNIIVGDLEKCKVVLSAHYDTAPVLPFPNFLAPKNMIAYLVYCILLALGIGTITGVLGFVASLLTDEPLIILIVLYAFLIFLIGWMFVGKENKHTANDNTSGVITLIEALHDENIKNQVCCVFFDHEEVGLFGSSAFYKQHKKIMKNKLIINFDCVSDGNYLLLILSKQAKSLEEKAKQSFVSNRKKQIIVTSASNTLYPSDQMNFKNYIGVAAFKKAPLIGLYIDRIHTSKDVIFDEENIQCILEGLSNFLKGCEFDVSI